MWLQIYIFLGSLNCIVACLNLYYINSTPAWLNIFVAYVTVLVGDFVYHSCKKELLAAANNRACAASGASSTTLATTTAVAATALPR
jgi:hypothetical protein